MDASKLGLHFAEQTPEREFMVVGPFNPAPQDTVRWGDQSFDEMLIGYLSFHYGTPERLGTTMASEGKEPVPARAAAGTSR